MPNTIIIGSIPGSKGPETARRVSLIVLPGFVYPLNDEWLVGCMGVKRLYDLWDENCRAWANFI